MLAPTICWGQDLGATPQRPPDLTTLSLEALMDVRVTSAAKKEQIVAESAAAVYVIGQEDILRSGATNIVDVLRMVPGLEVAQIDANKWAVSARGFNGRFSDKMLVLIDGRSVYTPLFSGVFWDVQDMMLEDVDRIEVIRGPGAALWGANAVNGVINIIPKDARITQGGLVSAGGGSKERGFGAVRYGGTMGRAVAYRVYAKYFNRAGYEDASGASAHDGWDVLRGGFRIDAETANRGSMTLTGNVYNGDSGGVATLASPRAPFVEGFVSPSTMSGGNLLGRWRLMFSQASDLSIQAYYDRTDRTDTAVFREMRDTVDLDVQHRTPFGPRQDIVWGFGYNFTTDTVAGRHQSIMFNPASRGAHLTSAFGQSDIAITPQVRATLGSKLEWNDYTGFEWQPSARLLWRLTGRQTLWSAVSRAVRTPARFEHDARVDLAALPVAPNQIGLAAFIGDRDFDAERLVASELGYRAQLAPAFSVDGTLFYNAYAGLRTSEPGTAFVETTPLPPHLVIPVRPENLMDGAGHGVEVATIWNVTPRWKVSSAYSWFRLELRQQASSLAVGAENAEGNSPRHRVHVRSFVDLPYGLAFDSAWHHVSRIPNQAVPQYARVDARLAWYPARPVELSLALQNLFNDRHAEVGPSFLVAPVELERSAYAKVTWRF